MQDVPETSSEETEEGSCSIQRLRKALSEKSAYAPPDRSNHSRQVAFAILAEKAELFKAGMNPLSFLYIDIRYISN